MKIDPYKHKESWIRWKVKVRDLGFIPDTSRQNSSIILRYLEDMELGVNVALGSKKGARSYSRLNTMKHRILLLCKKFEEELNVSDFTQLTESQICQFFTDMRNGKLKRLDGRRYRAVRDFVKTFKALWHWHQRVSRKAGIDVEDITLYLDASGEKPRWVYMTEEQIKKLYDNAKPRYKALIMFLFDTGIRAPTELVNIKVSDFSKDFKELNIRDETSKTFGRRIKLMLCSQVIKDHIKENNLEFNDYVFPFNPSATNRYLKRLARSVLGNGVSLAGQRYTELTMYDFRHCSCCYWLPRYKSESALKFRFGWKKSDKIHYYSEMLGMRDTISEEDLLIDVTKTEIEQRLLKSEKQNDLLKERITAIEKENKQNLVMIHELVRRISPLVLNIDELIRK